MAALKGDRVKVKMSDFVPETYRIDNVKDRETFLDIYKGMSEGGLGHHPTCGNIYRSSLVIAV